MGGAIFTCFQSRVRAHEKKRTESAALEIHASLVADRVQTRGDMTERRAEGAVRRARADVGAKCADPREHCHHRVFANSADGEFSRLRIREAIVEAARKFLVGLIDTGRAEKIGGRKQLSGRLLGLAGDDVLIDVPGAGETRLPLAAVHSAKLVLTDRLIAATAPLSADGADIIEETNEGQD